MSQDSCQSESVGASFKSAFGATGCFNFSSNRRILVHHALPYQLKKIFLFQANFDYKYSANVVTNHHSTFNTLQLQ